MDHQAFAQLLGNYGEFVGAVAVVATLAYLAVQIRQSNVAAQAASIQAFFAAFNSFADVKQDVTFIQVIRKGFAGWEGLSQDEQVQVHMYWSQYLSNLHMGYRLYRRGVLDEGSYSGFEDYFLSVLQTPGIKGWWAEHGPIFPEDFRDRMADRLRNASKKPARITELYPTMWATR